MKKSYTTLHTIVMILISCLPLVSCNHKDIIYDETETPEVEIVFDWRKAPDAKPGSVVTYLFSESNEQIPLRYNFGGRDGGKANVPGGEYVGIGMNSDVYDWARFRNIDDKDFFEVYTDDLTSLTTYGLDTRSLPRLPDAGDERMAEAVMGQIWSDSSDAISIDPYSQNQRITFYPEEITCHYTVTVKDIENIDYLKGANLDATLSGLSESYRVGRRSASESPVTMPVVLRQINTGNTVFGSFINFGETTDLSRRHVLTIYLVFEDHTGSYATYDVTEQVRNAPDPHHVDIVVSGLSLPHPIAAGSGFVPNVNDWKSVDYTLEM